MLYAYIFLGAGILILSILFRLAAVFRLTIPLLYALVVPTLLSDWYYAHYTLANVIWYILLAVTALSWWAMGHPWVFALPGAALCILGFPRQRAQQPEPQAENVDSPE